MILEILEDTCLLAPEKFLVSPMGEAGRSASPIFTEREQQGIEDYHFLDQPEKQREYNGKMYGKTLWFDKGYDTDNIKIEIPYPV